MELASRQVPPVAPDPNLADQDFSVRPEAFRAARSANIGAVGRHALLALHLRPDGLAIHAQGPLASAGALVPVDNEEAALRESILTRATAAHPEALDAILRLAGGWDLHWREAGRELLVWRSPHHVVILRPQPPVGGDPNLYADLETPAPIATVSRWDLIEAMRYLQAVRGSTVAALGVNLGLLAEGIELAHESTEGFATATIPDRDRDPKAPARLVVGTVGEPLLAFAEASEAPALQLLLAPRKSTVPSPEALPRSPSAAGVLLVKSMAAEGGPPRSSHLRVASLYWIEGPKRKTTLGP